MDRALVRGQLSIVFWLAGAAIILALLATGLVELLHLRGPGKSLGWGSAFWQELVRTLDPGQITEDTAGFALLSLGVTLVGLLIVSTLISLVNNRIERRVESLRRGRDPVHLSPGHIAVLGWSDIAAKVIEQLAEASGGTEPQEVAVMAPRSVQDMRHELMESEVLGRVARHWPLLRSGTASDTRDLQRLALIQQARCVIVLHDDEGEGVADTVKAVMAVVAACEGPTHTASIDDHPMLVLEVPKDPDGTIRDLARRLKRFGFDVIAVDSTALRTELAAQVKRRAGLSAVFRDLLNFEGDELYLVDAPPALAAFGDALVRLAQTVPIGVVQPGSTPQVDLWPDWSQPLVGKQLIVLAPDLEAAGACTTFHTADVLSGDPRPRCSARRLERRDLLVIGWNDGAAHLIEVIDQYAGPGSTLTVAAGHVGPVDLPDDLTNLRTTEVLELGAELQSWLDAERDHYDHAVVLSDDHKSPAASDADTFLTLLALRPSGRAYGNPTTVVAQLRERANKHLARQSLADDVVVGDALTATTIAQLAMSPRLAPVLRALLGHTPFTLDNVPPEALNLVGEVSFAAVTRAAAAGGEIALGWRHQDGTLELNPPKAATMPAEDLSGVVILTRVAAGAFDPPALVDR